jgi:ABC-2 type transport system ATP-binding protein
LSDPAEVLHVEDLHRRYGRKKALDGISFTVRRGDVFGFLGPNGAGKTTTIRIVLGLIRATRGRVRLFGRPRRGAALSALGRIGAVVEAPRFYPGLSGRQNLGLLATLSGVPSSRIAPALETVRLTEAADEAVRGYSQGMRQRLGIAQALLSEPEFVILDEPTNGLDPHGVMETRRLIVELARKREITFLVSSHQLIEIEAIANRVAILRRGKLLVTGDLDEILAGETTRYRFVVSEPERAAPILGCAGADPEGRLRIETAEAEVPELVRRLVSANIEVREVVRERRTLEDYFLEKTRREEADLGR